MVIKKHLLVAGMLTSSMWLTATHAATVTLEGANIRWVYDTTLNATALSVLGTPTLVGDSVQFSPTSFTADATGAVGVVSTSATFVFDHVISKNGNNILSIQATDSGNYSIVNGSDVGNDLFLQAVQVGSPSKVVSQAESYFNDSSSSGSWSLGNSLTTIGGPSVAPFSTLTSATDLKLTIQDTLTATALGANEHASIQKSSLLVTAVTPVPVPGSVWLLGSALLGFAGLRRRKLA